jgi:hypothetical protein
MKTQIRIFALVLVLTGISISTFAQVNATANTSATIVTPIAISKSVDMNFGNVAVSATAGTVILTPEGSRSLTGGVTLPTIAGTVAAASFNVTGAANYTYNITLPSSALTISSGSNNMTVNAFASNPATTGTLNASGSQVLNVGATLNVGASQPAGSYTSASPFIVTVNYN